MSWGNTPRGRPAAAPWGRQVPRRPCGPLGINPMSSQQFSPQLVNKSVHISVGTRAGPGRDPGGTRAGPGPTRELDRLQTAPEGDPVCCWCGPQPLPHVESGSPELCAPRTGHGTGCWTVPKCLFAAAKECGPAHQGALRWRGRVPHDPCGAEKGTLCTPHVPRLRPRRRTRAAQSQGLCSQRPAQPPDEPRGCPTAPRAAPMGGMVPLSSGFHMGSGERATPGQLVGNSPTLR